MSVLLVTDHADDDISIQSNPNAQHEYLYQQLKEFQDEFTFSFISIDSSSSTIVRQAYCRRRYRRPQQCLVKSLFTYMLTLLFLTNYLHWPILVITFSSMKFISTYASTPISSTPSIARLTPPLLVSLPEDDRQCVLINRSHIDRLCSRTCRAQQTPFEKLDTINQLLLDIHYLPFCSSYLLNHSINRTNFLNETTENECQQIFHQLITLDDEARQASALFTIYMQAIDSGAKENRYSIIDSDCQRAYRTWTCSVKIPFFHRYLRVPPCQTICDEVERVCPTFRPSDREPLFAGQPLFFCSGGIVANSDYAQRPHCFDTCHLAGGALQRHSVSSSSSISSLDRFVESIAITPQCFDIKPLSPSQTEQISSSSSSSSVPVFINGSTFNYTSNTSVSASTISLVSSRMVVASLTLISLLQRISEEFN